MFATLSTYFGSTYVVQFNKFGGVFEVLARRNKPSAHSYKIELREDLMGPFIKRLWVKFRPPGRAIRLNMETHLDQIEVVSILELPYAGEPFPGHDQINDPERA